MSEIHPSLKSGRSVDPRLLLPTEELHKFFLLSSTIVPLISYVFTRHLLHLYWTQMFISTANVTGRTSLCRLCAVSSAYSDVCVCPFSYSLSRVLSHSNLMPVVRVLVCSEMCRIFLQILWSLGPEPHVARAVDKDNEGMRVIISHSWSHRTLPVVLGCPERTLHISEAFLSTSIILIRNICCSVWWLVYDSENI